MNLKLFVFKIILSLLLLTGNAFSKNIPPGSGIGDVPANVLILLDKSGSMSARMTSGAGVYYPESVAQDGSGGVFAGQYSSYGIKNWTVKKPKDLKKIISQAIKYNKGPCLIDIISQPLEEAKAPVSEWIA